MLARVWVLVANRANDFAAQRHRLAHQRQGAGLLDDALLREGDDLGAHAGAHLLAGCEHALDAAQAQQRVDLGVEAHARRTEAEAPTQQTQGAFAHGLGGDGRLSRPHVTNRLRDVAGLGAVGVEGLVGMQMRIREARRDEAHSRVEHLMAERRNDADGLDGRDGAVLNQNVDQATVRQEATRQQQALGHVDTGSGTTTSPSRATTRPAL